MTNELVTVTNVVSREITGLDVVKQVDEFYSAAFDHLLWTLGTLILLLGVVVPLVFYFFQKRQLTLKEKSLAGHLSNQFEKLEAALRKENTDFVTTEKKTLEQELKRLEMEIDRKSNEAACGIYLIQANNYREKKNYGPALIFLNGALNYIIKNETATTVQRLLHLAAEEYLPKMSREDFKDTRIATDLEEILKSATEIKAQGLLNVAIEKVKKELEQAQQREVK